MNNVASFFKVSKDEAKQRILTVESERIAFMKKYFNINVLDPVHYDIIINTQFLNLDEAPKIVIAAYESKIWQDFSPKKVLK